MSEPVVVVGAGIIGLAVARLIAQRGDQVVVLEKENAIATHQTGRNSGVVHAGIYYAPGSLKARTAVAGRSSMVGFAKERAVAVAECGKLVVATSSEEIAGLRKLAERATANGVEARLIGPEQARDIEPHAFCLEALQVPSTAIINFAGVCEVLRADIEAAGGEIRTGTGFISAAADSGGLIVESDRGEIRAAALINCAGLYADKVALACGVDPEARIVPFRGEFFELVPGRRDWVRGLIYPVPDPDFPFLGVHLTRNVDGGVHAGPNAVLALRREGYRWRDLDRAELRDSVSWPGFQKLAAAHWRAGSREVLRSFSKRAFASSVARLVPGISATDLVRAPAGVRAQALRADGTLVEDFLIKPGPRQVHVINAPSPGATAAFEIAAHVVAQLDANRR